MNQEVLLLQRQGIKAFEKEIGFQLEMSHYEVINCMTRKIFPGISSNYRLLSIDMSWELVA